jgi:phosphoribosyl 1,2-cyclic phosphate phosphodiesterase
MAKATATLLGTGTSNGVPSLGKVYTPEFLADPRNHRMRCSLALQGPAGNVLVDCTPEMRLQLLRAEIRDLEAVIITHTHADHVMGMDDLRAFSMHSQRAVPVYTLPVFQADIRRIYPYAFAEFPPGIFVPRFELRDVPSVLEVAGMSIEVLEVEHGPIPCLGVRVNNFAYLTDVSHIPPAAWDQLQGLDVLVLDAVRHKPHPNHFHLAKALEVAEALGAKRTYLTHLCDEYDHGPFEKTLPDHIRLAYDGLSFSV